MRILPEKERLQTLADLNDAKHHLTVILDKMPIGRKTKAMETYRTDCENKLNKLNLAIEKY